MLSVKSDNLVLNSNTPVCSAIHGACYKWATPKAVNAMVSEVHQLDVNRNLEKMRFLLNPIAHKQSGFI